MKTEKLFKITDVKGNTYILNTRYIVQIDTNGKHISILYHIPSNPSSIMNYNVNKTLDQIYEELS